MSATAILISFLSYTFIIFFIAWLTSRNSSNDAFFTGNRRSPWVVVAYGMIGASLSGVTFISVPGWVGDTQFSYLMIVIGYILGYLVIALVLLPVYYKLNLTSIYSYLDSRFGFWSYKTGAAFFLISRIIGASFRMFLVINVLQLFVFDALGIPFGITVIAFMLLIWLYTFRGGIKTIVWTDTLQTTFMLLAVVLSVIFVIKDFNMSLGEMYSTVMESGYARVVDTDIYSKQHWLKQLLSGAFIAIVMTGLDQDMMQKNLSCRTLLGAQKNVVTLSISLVFVNILFLFLGAVLYLYADKYGISGLNTSDDLFPTVALKYLGPVAGITFIIGLISAAYSSADSALTSLTTSFSVDFLSLEKNVKKYYLNPVQIRKIVHISISVILIIVIVLYRAINDQAVISKLFTIAGYTYGPLLGLYSFGLFTKRNVQDRFVPVIAILSPMICFLLSEQFTIGFELLIYNGLITFIGLLLISRRLNPKHT